MKKIILLMFLTSCTTTHKINESIKDLETLQTWVNNDYHRGDVPYGPANNYYIILESIINDLNNLKNDKQKH
jgi:hypothetical protein